MDMWYDRGNSRYTETTPIKFHVVACGHGDSTNLVMPVCLGGTEEQNERRRRKRHVRTARSPV
jgi:hypothetical protein